MSALLAMPLALGVCSRTPEASCPQCARSNLRLDTTYANFAIAKQPAREGGAMGGCGLPNVRGLPWSCTSAACHVSELKVPELFNKH
ncbi:MAG: hypothetical protein FRX49_05236 [Trebouxia sp. A1-2]|nr:MAG: hypothetical protein FRX49_05236 [Trebouxia sp. A1-2]